MGLCYVASFRSNYIEVLACTMLSLVEKSVDARWTLLLADSMLAVGFQVEKTVSFKKDLDVNVVFHRHLVCSYY